MEQEPKIEKKGFDLQMFREKFRTFKELYDQTKPDKVPQGTELDFEVMGRVLQEMKEMLENK